jgi:cytochrome c-type biogenesis protein CcmH
MMRGIAFVLALALSAAAGAIEDVAPFPDAATQARYEHLVKELRCLVCQNQSIADSNAPLAADLRRDVREMMMAGKSDEEIKEFMVQRYGEWILYRPRLLRQTWLLWGAPALLLVLGFGIVGRVIYQRGRAYEDAPDSEPQE